MMFLRIAAAVASLCAVEAAPDQVVLGSSNVADFVRPEGNLPTLSDLLTLETRASIFYSYSREVDIGARFTQHVGEGEGVTVFVPTNKAVQALSRKPNQDPHADPAAMSSFDFETISRSNVRRWVGAHIVPNDDVDFSSSEPYKTLTSGATISFKPVAARASSSSANEHHFNSDAERLVSVKVPVHAGSVGPHVDTDADHFPTIKGPATKSGDAQDQCPPVVDTDAGHLPTIKGPQGSPLMKFRLGLAAAGRFGAARSAPVKGPVSPDRVSQAQPPDETPAWKQYELNDGVHVISKKQASNGVMYLIDGTVLV